MTAGASLTDEELVRRAIWAGGGDDVAAEGERALERIVAEVARLREWREQFGSAIEAYRAAWPNPASAIPATNAINALVNAYDDLASR